MPPPQAAGPRLVPVLLALTVSTGVVDAVSFLGLGRIFTANMTGNVVLLGFALAGAPGLSAARSSAALAGFLLGAVLGGRLVKSMNGESAQRRLSAACFAEAGLLLLALLAGLGVPGAPTGEATVMYAVITLTAVAMGIRTAVIRNVAVPDLTTTVLTLTIAGLAADSSLAGGGNPRWPRRLASVLAILGGAAVGAVLVRHSLALPLGLCAFLACAGAVVLRAQERGERAGSPARRPLN